MLKSLLPKTCLVEKTLAQNNRWIKYFYKGNRRKKGWQIKCWQINWQSPNSLQLFTVQHVSNPSMPLLARAISKSLKFKLMTMSYVHSSSHILYTSKCTCPIMQEQMNSYHRMALSFIYSICFTVDYYYNSSNTEAL